MKEAFFLEAKLIPAYDRLEDIRALFQMTPYCWKTPREGVEALSALKRLTTQVGFDLHVFRRSPA